MPASPDYAYQTLDRAHNISKRGEKARSMPNPMIRREKERINNAVTGRMRMIGLPSWERRGKKAGRRVCALFTTQTAKRWKRTRIASP